MMKEKRGVVEPGRTPPETDEKQASEDSLEDHLTKRAADAATGSFRKSMISQAKQAIPKKPIT